jgi:hypothetical protein
VAAGNNYRVPREVVTHSDSPIGGGVVGGGGQGFTKDGAAATGPTAGIDGLTVDRQGRLLYSEARWSSNYIVKLIRRVEADGRIRTIAGKTATFNGPMPMKPH